MKTIQEQIADKCIHFTGLGDSECKAGVNYNDVKVRSTKPLKIPCLKDMNGGSCIACEFPSKEYVEKAVNEINLKIAKTLGSYALIKAQYEKTKEATGKIKCPECGGELHYTVAQINNHIHAKCNGCDMGWIE